VDVRGVAVRIQAQGAHRAAALDDGFEDDYFSIELELLDASGSFIDSSTSTSDIENIRYRAESAETVVIRVWLFNDDGSHEGNDYSMTIDVF